LLFCFDKLQVIRASKARPFSGKSIKPGWAVSSRKDLFLMPDNMACKNENKKENKQYTGGYKNEKI